MKKKKKVEQVNADTCSSSQQNNGMPSTVALSKKSIYVGVLIVLVLLIVSIIMAYTLPTGRYPTITDDKGNVSIDSTKDFEYDPTLQRVSA